MRITVVDPAAYTPPYDHSLCAALARRGHDVELATGDFRHGPVPAAVGYERSRRFYRFGGGSAAKAVQHPFDMIALARRARRERHDVVHFQWLPIPQLDLGLVRAFPRPTVLTAHDVLPRVAGTARRRAAARLLEALDAIVVHSDSGRERIVQELGVAGDKVSVIPHGAFDYLTRLPDERPIDPALGDLEGRRVVLCFGLVRPYKGLDVLIEAFAEAPEDAVLLVVGRAMMPVEPLQRRVRELGIAERVRFLTRFVADAEVPAYFRRADLVVLPYRETEQSGVLFTALAFGRPLVVSAVGGFVEVAERHGAARLVPPGDAAALASAMSELLGDDRARETLADAARRAAAGPYSWEEAAERTSALYRSLLERA